MKHYGPTPPWEGYSRYGSWERGEELWTGEQEWIYIAPSMFGRRFTVELAGILKDVYLDTVRTQLGQPILPGMLIDIGTPDDPTKVAAGAVVVG